MKHISIYILILIFLFVSCGQTENKAIDNRQQLTSTSFDSLQAERSSKHQNMLGIWTNCATNYNGVITTANVCKTIEFKVDNSGSIIYPSQKKQMFNWSMTNDQLILNFKEDKKDNYRTLAESPFEVHLTEENLSLDLELKSKNENIIYYLGRQK